MNNKEKITVENLKCCGNCSRNNCKTDRGNLDDDFSKYCDRWEWDYLRNEDRIIN